MKKSCLELLVFKPQNRVCFCSMALARGSALQLRIVYVVSGHWAEGAPGVRGVVNTGQVTGEWGRARVLSRFMQLSSRDWVHEQACGLHRRASSVDKFREGPWLSDWRQQRHSWTSARPWRIPSGTKSRSAIFEWILISTVSLNFPRL